MAITFYYGSGSPFAWRVWLALEYKALEYDMKVLSFSDGDLKKPGFASLNPRRKVPVLLEEQPDQAPFAIYESAAILEYLDDAYPDSGGPLFPRDPRARALVRRMVCEADNYVGPSVNRLLARVLFTPEGQWKEDRIAAARQECVEEFDAWETQIRGDHLAGPLSAADLTLYPMVALALRCEKKMPSLALGAALPEKLRNWMQRVERLPITARTRPPHWK